MQHAGEGAADLRVVCYRVHGQVDARGSVVGRLDVGEHDVWLNARCGASDGVHDGRSYRVVGHSLAGASLHTARDKSQRTHGADGNTRGRPKGALP